MYWEKRKNLLKKKTNFELNFDGKRIYPGTVAELIEAVKSIDIWGYCDTITNGNEYPIIHYWVGTTGKAGNPEIMELFAHEICHAIGYESEGMAVKFGGVASFAYTSMLEELS